jgi:hypothetical protein
MYTRSWWQCIEGEFICVSRLPFKKAVEKGETYNVKLEVYWKEYARSKAENFLSSVYHLIRLFSAG